MRRPFSVGIAAVGVLGGQSGDSRLTEGLGIASYPTLLAGALFPPILYDSAYTESASG